MFIFRNRGKSQKGKSDLIIEDQYVLDNENDSKVQYKYKKGFLNAIIT